MGLSLHNIKRWLLMLTGNSIYHVDQGIGKAISLGGYYNDMTQKVIMGDSNVDESGIPFLVHKDGTHIHMPTMVFQYGLGAYDLWLLEKNRENLDRSIRCADWALEHQQDDGAWNNFYYIIPNHPYSAMPQGEAASLLLRVWNETGEEKYKTAAEKAVTYMLTSIDDGGVSLIDGNDWYLMEYVHKPTVLNGWVFALFGLYDMNRVNASEITKTAWVRSIDTLKRTLPEFDNGFWSMYNCSGTITSSFYHKLHIAQMNALYQLTGETVFAEYEEKWTRYQQKLLNRSRAFVIKSVQKLKERG